MKYPICLLLLLLTIVSVTAQQKSIQLSLNENPYGPPKGVKEGITREMANMARYPGNESEGLIAAIAKREGVGEDQIIIGEILEQLGIYLGLQGGPGAEFIYAVPGYPVFVNAAAKTGGRVVSVPLNDKKENDLAAIADSVSSRTKAIFLVNPHNPSGTVTERQTLYHFLHKVSAHALVIVDEAYLEYSDDFKGRTAVNNIRAGDNVMVFRTFAKAYGLAGLSIGYCVASRSTAKWLKELGLGNVHDLNRLSVAAATAALRDTAYITDLNKTITAERNKWNQLLDSLGVQHTSSQANFVYFNTGKSYEAVEPVFKQSGITIGRVFAPYSTWIRITIGLPAENEKAKHIVRRLLFKTK
jgi:histidinol-phosphate aminotransferase